MTPRIHHFGMLVKNLEKFLEQSVWQLHGAIVTDPIQRARLCMVTTGVGEPLVELIEPLDENSPTWRATAVGQTWHHVCFSVPTTRDADDYISARRLLPITPWHPAALFGGRGIRFACSRNREILEFLSDEVVD